MLHISNKSSNHVHYTKQIEYLEKKIIPTYKSPINFFIFDNYSCFKNSKGRDGSRKEKRQCKNLPYLMNPEQLLC